MPGLDGPVGRHQVLALDPADLGVQLPLLLHRDGLAAHGDELLEDLDELHPRLVGLVDLVQRLQRLDVGAVELHRVEPRPQGVALAIEALAVHSTQGLVRGHPPRGLVDHVDLPLQDLDQLVPALGRLVQRRQLTQRQGILAPQVEHPVPQIDRVRLAAQGLRRQLGHPLVAAGHVVVGVRDVDHLLVDLEQLLPAVLHQVQRLQALQGHRVAGVVVQRPVVGRNGLVGVAQVLLVDLGQPHLQGHQGLTVHGDPNAPLEDLRQILRHPVGRVDPIEGLQRARVLGVDLQHAAVGLDRPGRVGHLLVEHPSRAQQHRLPGLGRGVVLEDLIAHVDDVPPQLGRLGQPLQLVGDLLVERIVHIGPQPPDVGVLGLAQATLADLGHVLDDGQALYGVLGGPQLGLAELHQLGPALRRVVDRLEDLGDVVLVLALGKDQLQRVLGLGVPRVDVEDLPIRLDRRARLADADLVDLPHAEVERDDVRLVGGDRDLPPQVLHQLGPALQVGEDPIERSDRLQVLRIRVEDLQVVGDRLVHVAQALLVDHRQAQQHLHLGHGVEDLVGLVGQQRRELLPVLRGLGEAVQLLHRLFRLRVGVQGPGVGVEGLFELAQLALVDRRHLVEPLDLGERILGVGDHHVVDVDQQLPLGQLLVQRRQHLGGGHRLVVASHDPIEGLDGRGVGVVVGEHLAVGLDGPHHVAQLVLPQATDPEPDRGLLVGGRGRVDRSLEDLQLVEPALGLAVEAVEGRDRLVVPRIEVEDLLVGVDRSIDVLQLGVVDLAQHEQRLAPLLGILGQLALPLVDVLELLPVLQLDVELDQGVERGPVGVIDGHHLLVQLDGPAGVLHHRLADVRGVEQQRLLVLGVLLHLRLADDGGHQGLEAVGAAVHLDERIDRLEVARLDLQDLLVAGRRLVGVVDRRLVGLRHLGEDLDPEHVVDHVVDHPLVQGHHLAVGAHLRGQTIQAPLGLLVGGVFLERAPVGVESLLGLVARDLEQLADLVEQPDLLARIERVLDHDLVGHHQVRPVVGRPVVGLEDLGHRQLVLFVLEQPLEGPERVLVGGIELEHLPVGLHGQAALIEPGQAQLPQAQVQLDLLGRVVRQRQLPRQVLGQLAPRLRLEVQAVERGDRREVGVVVGQDLVVGGDRVLGLPQHLLLQARDLEAQRLTSVGIGL